MDLILAIFPGGGEALIKEYLHFITAGVLRLSCSWWVLEWQKRRWFVSYTCSLYQAVDSPPRNRDALIAIRPCWVYVQVIAHPIWSNPALVIEMKRVYLV